MRYVTIYTNDKTVQGHHVYCLVNKLNALLQGKIQRVTPTYPMQVSTAILYHSGGIVCLSVNFIHVGVCWNICLRVISV